MESTMPMISTSIPPPPESPHTPLQRPQPQRRSNIRRNVITPRRPATRKYNNKYQRCGALDEHDHPVNMVRPSLAGWWVCCTCQGMNNPHLCPERCSLCSHERCEGCITLPWWDLVWSCFALREISWAFVSWRLIQSLKLKLDKSNKYANK